MRGRCFASSAELSLTLLQGKWKASIISCLRSVPTMRYGDIRRALPGLTDKVLTRRLRDLEETGLVQRTRLPRAQVSYTLTEKGRSLTPVMLSLQAWGVEAGRSIDARFILH